MTKDVKFPRGVMSVKETMSQREQQYYYAVFKATEVMELECKNKIKLYFSPT
jgi:hypothetical protein